MPSSARLQNMKALRAVYYYSTFVWLRDIIVRAKYYMQFYTPPGLQSNIGLSGNQIQYFKRRPAPTSSTPTITSIYKYLSEPSRLPSQNKNKMWWHAPAHVRLCVVMARPWPCLFECWQTYYQHAPAKKMTFLYGGENTLIIYTLIEFAV